MVWFWLVDQLELYIVELIYFDVCANAIPVTVVINIPIWKFHAVFVAVYFFDTDELFEIVGIDFCNINWLLVVQK